MKKQEVIALIKNAKLREGLALLLQCFESTNNTYWYQIVIGLFSELNTLRLKMGQITFDDEMRYRKRITSVAIKCAFEL